MHNGRSIGIAHRAQHEPKRCEQTELTIPECSCPRCWARLQASEEVRHVIAEGGHPIRHVIDAGIR
jgi:hypothetical protein